LAVPFCAVLFEAGEEVFFPFGTAFFTNCRGVGGAVIVEGLIVSFSGMVLLLKSSPSEGMNHSFISVVRRLLSIIPSRLKYFNTGRPT
jgi:hypothetical protein